jgi:hypothetical protein
MGPTCRVIAETIAVDILLIIDSTLESLAEDVERTRKGRIWDVWIEGRPFHVDASAGEIALSAGCNDGFDWDILRRLAQGIASAVDGVATEPEK